MEQLGDRVGLKFDQRPAFAADQMVVLGVSVVVLEDIAVVLASHFAEQARLFQLK